MRDIYEVLERWGVWARDSSGIDYSPIAAGFRGLLPYESKGKSSCSDDEGLLIDGCIARLRDIKLDEYEVVVAHHFYGVSLRKIAFKRKCSDGTIRKQMKTAEGFVLGLLCILDVKCMIKINSIAID
ncbi:antiterminator Q family protein [Serratia quinivorans]|uniref:antiterminator Q family protein n=1 Tax=Serratia quinivorans TaxID=137545 RepID=UPI000F8201E7|nr:antiterminator Q family protein [Serratia quinivorans]